MSASPSATANVDRGAHVLAVGVEPVEPLAGLRRSPCPLSPPSTSSRVARACARGGRRRASPALVEPLERVLADRLEHLEAAVRGWSTQALLDQRGDRRRARPTPHTASAASSVKPPTNTPRRANSRLRRRGRAGRSSSRSPRAASAGAAGASRGPALSRSSRRAEALEDRGRREHLHARGGELDRERQPVEPGADLLDALARRRRRAAAAGRARGRGAGTARPRARRASGGIASSCSPAIRSAARLVTTSFEPRRGGEQRGSSSGAASSTCSKLSITSSSALAGAAARVEASPSLRAERLRDLRHDPRRLVERRQRHEAGAVREPRREPVRELEREPRLADPARPGQREQADVGVGEQRGGGLEVLLAAEQRRRRDRQRRRRRGAGGAGAAAGAPSSSAGSWARIAASRRWSSRPGSSPRSSTSAWRARR